jgi:cytochrome b subunit of formate dehydrogenase
MASDRQHAADDIRKLEQDLENLERCYAVLSRGAEQVKVAFFVYLVALAVLAIGGFFLTKGLLLSAFSCIILITSLIVAHLAHARGMRWIDIVGWSFFAVNRTEAQAVEDMITDRKARLASLKQV